MCVHSFKKDPSFSLLMAIKIVTMEAKPAEIAEVFESGGLGCPAKPFSLSPSG